MTAGRYKPPGSMNASRASGSAPRHEARGFSSVAETIPRFYARGLTVSESAGTVFITRIRVSMAPATCAARGRWYATMLPKTSARHAHGGGGRSAATAKRSAGWSGAAAPYLNVDRARAADLEVRLRACRVRPMLSGGRLPRAHSRQISFCR